MKNLNNQNVVVFGNLVSNQSVNTAAVVRCRAIALRHDSIIGMLHIARLDRSILNMALISGPVPITGPITGKNGWRTLVPQIAFVVYVAGLFMVEIVRTCKRTFGTELKRQLTTTLSRRLYQVLPALSEPRKDSDLVQS